MTFTNPAESWGIEWDLCAISNNDIKILLTEN
jgi:hypothetical protein